VLFLFLKVESITLLSCSFTHSFIHSFVTHLFDLLLPNIHFIPFLHITSFVHLFVIATNPIPNFASPLAVTSNSIPTRSTLSKSCPPKPISVRVSTRLVNSITPIPAPRFCGVPTVATATPRIYWPRREIIYECGIVPTMGVDEGRSMSKKNVCSTTTRPRNTVRP
jgi:hypothetical protein